MSAFFILWVNFKYVRLYVQPVPRNFGVFQLEWLACISADALKILASPMSAPLCYFFRSGASYVSLQSVELLRSFRRITCACNLPTSVSRGRGGKNEKASSCRPPLDSLLTPAWPLPSTGARRSRSWSGQSWSSNERPSWWAGKFCRRRRPRKRSWTDKSFGRRHECETAQVNDPSPFLKN